MTDDLSTHLNEALQDPVRRRRYAQNRVIIDTAVALNRALEASGLTQRELAERLDKSEGYVSQVLSGGTNMTLRTLGDFAHGLSSCVNVSLETTQGLTWLGVKGRTSWKSDDVDLPKAVRDNEYALAA